MDSPDSEGKHEYYDRLTERVEAAMRMRTSADWTRALNAVGVPVAAVKFPVELFEDEHANANAMFHRLEHPEAGDFTVLSPPVAMDSNGFRPREAPGPFGSETDAVLSEIGFADAQVDELVAAKVTRRRHA